MESNGIAPNYKLGKLKPRHDARTLKLADFISAPLDQLEIPPDNIRYGDAVGDRFPMYQNDEIGDCAVAGPAHMIQVWTANTGKMFTPKLSAVLDAYHDISGWPASGDNGCALLDVCKYWQSQGIDGHRIEAFALVDTKNLLEIKLAHHWFGGLLWGLGMPKSFQGQPKWEVPGTGWNDGPGEPYSWGGHCVNGANAGVSGFDVVTWGGLKPVDAIVPPVYGDEIYALLSPEWMDARGVAPNGLNIAALRAKLKQIQATPPV